MARFGDLSAVLREESKKKGRKPRVGIEIDPGGMNQYLSTHETFTTDGNTYTGLISANGAPVITRAVPRMGGLGIISEMNFSVPNQGLYSSIFATYPDPRGLSVDVYLYFDDGTALLDAERTHIFSGEISEFPLISYSSVDFITKSRDFKTGSKIGTLLTDADAVSESLPESSKGKIQPIVIGDHKSFKGRNSKALDEFSFDANPSECMHLGLDDDGRHYWRVSEHELKSIGKIFTIETGVADSLDFFASAVEYNAVLDAGEYSGAELAAEIKSKVDALITPATVTVTYAEDTGLFTISAGAPFDILWATGTNTTESIATLLGFDYGSDDTGGSSYTSDFAAGLAQINLWGWEERFRRYVRLNSFTLEQNDGNGCIISHSGDPSYIDYHYNKGTITTGSAGTGVDFTNPANAGDFDLDSISFGEITTGAKTTTPAAHITFLTIPYPDWDHGGIQNDDIVSVRPVGYYEATFGGGATNASFPLILGGDILDPEEAPYSSSPSYPDQRHPSQPGLAATRVGAAADLDVRIQCNTTNSAHFATLTVYHTYKEIRYRSGMLPLYAAVEGKMYDSNIDSRTQGDEDHIDNGNSGELTKNAAGVTEWFLRDYLGYTDSDIDLAVFNETSRDLSFTELSFALTEQFWFNDLIDEMVASFGSALMYNFEDKVTLRAIVRDNVFGVSDEIGPAGEELYNFDPQTPFTITAGINDSIDFSEGGAELTATLTSGDYTGDTMAVEIEAQLEAAGADSYTVTYSGSTNKFTIVNDSANFVIFWFSGSNAGSSAGTLLGFAQDSLGSGANLLTAGAVMPDSDETNATTGWVAPGNTVLESITGEYHEDDKLFVSAQNGGYLLKARTTSGVSYLYHALTVVAVSRYLFKGYALRPSDVAKVQWRMGTTTGGFEIFNLLSIGISQSWEFRQSGFIPGVTTAYLSNNETEVDPFYLDNVEVRIMDTDTYTSDIPVNDGMLATQPVMKAPLPEINKIKQEVVTDVTINYDFNYVTKIYQNNVQDTDTTYHSDGLAKTYDNPYTRHEPTAQYHLYINLWRRGRQFWGSNITAKLNAIGAERWDRINIRHPVGNSIFGSDESTKGWLILKQMLDLNSMEITFETEEI